MREIVKIFAEKMDKMLDEKFDEYQDSWKEESIDSLRDKLQTQVSKFVLRNLFNMSKEDIDRTLTHAGNYLVFILAKLNK